MELLLSGKMTIKEINRMFQKYFPYLKLEFYNSDHVPEQISLWDDRLDRSTRLCDIVGDLDSTIIEFDPTDSVAEFERKFESQLGLYVSVYQNINDVWYRVARTGQLDKQNTLATRPFRYSYNMHTLFL